MGNKWWFTLRKVRQGSGGTIPSNKPDYLRELF